MNRRESRWKAGIRRYPSMRLWSPEAETGPGSAARAVAGRYFPGPGGANPFVGRSGLEYLFGYLTIDEAGQEEYGALWGFTAAAEKRNFESFVDWVMARWEQYPDLHIYHYAPYEPSALKRLMGRHATREAEVDQMLRAGLFVDLYRVVRGGLRAGVESYSIKELEKFFAFTRRVSLSEANSALFAMSRLLEFGDGDTIHDAHKRGRCRLQPG